MASSVPSCDTCASQQKSTPGDIWCLECEESFCADCSKHHAIFKATKNHDTLPITEYASLPDFILKIEKHCVKHNEQFTVYCHNHACPACRSCSLEEHKLCSKVSKIEVVVGNAKSSSTLTEIEELLCNVLKNIDSLHAERTENVASLQKQKDQIVNDVAAIRLKINQHLDKMQLQIIKRLNENEKREREKTQSVLQSLSVDKSHVEELLKNMVAIKKHASDFQAFLAVREIEKRSEEIQKKITGMMEAGQFNNATLKHEEPPSVMAKLSSVEFGKIVTKLYPSKVKLKTSKQAQLPVVILPSYSIESVAVKLNRSINTDCKNTRGCVVLPDGRSLFTCYRNDSLTCFDKDRNREYVKRLRPHALFDVGLFEDMNTIYITSGGGSLQEFIEINLNHKNIKYLKTATDNYGVVVKQNKLIYCADDKGLCERNLSDGYVRVIVSEKFPSSCYVTEFRDQVYYTNNKNHSVTCCGMDGKQIWKFTNDVLKYPLGVSVDNYGNVYVVGCGSSNVVVISADGQRHREILSRHDGLCRPQVVYYRRSTNKLLVANEEGNAVLFDVSFCRTICLT